MVIKNNKFKYILNVLNKSKSNIFIDKLQPNATFNLSYPIEDTNYSKSKKSSLFNKIVKNVLNNKLIEKKNKQEKTDTNVIEKNIKNTSIEPVYKDLLCNSDQKDYIKNTFNNSNLSKLSTIYKIVEIKKTNKDNYSIILFKSIDPIFRNILDNKYINDLLKNHKLKAIDIFNKQNYYKTKYYSTKDFKKSDLDDRFSNNKNLTLSMLKVFSDIFNINLVYHNLNNGINDFIFMNNFIVQRATVLILENDSKLFTIVSKTDSYIKGTSLVQLLNINKKYYKDDLNILKLDILQNISRMKNINIKKKGKNGYINKLKDDLISDIIKLQ